MDARPSKTRVNTAGDRLADWWRGVGPDLPDEQLIKEVAVVRAWRRQHDYPLRLTMPSLRNWVDAESSLGINPAQRLKRLAQIVNKLARHPGMKLARMQDIGGCRAVLANAEEVERIAERIRDHWSPVGTADYREDPRDSGYRALHLIVKKEDRQISGDQRLVEIQLRTENEHRWAEAVARTGSRLGYALQDGDGPPELLLYFRMASDVLWLQARGESGDLDFRRRFGAVREQVRPYFQTNA